MGLRRRGGTAFASCCLVSGLVAAAVGCSSAPADVPVSPGAGDSGAATPPETAYEAGTPVVTVPADSGATPESSDDAAADAGEAGRMFAGDPAAIFVAPTGSDTAAGTLDAPVRTVAKGISLAQAKHKDVYLCNATYAEAVLVDTTPVGLHGGYDCTNGWQQVEDRATIAPSSGLPLTLRSIVGSITVEELQLQAPDGVQPGESSIAALVSGAPGVTFRHVTFQAGAGAPGASGAPVAPVTTPATKGNDGTSLNHSACSDSSGVCGQIGYGGAHGRRSGVPACEGRAGWGGSGANDLIGVAQTAPGVGSPAGLGGSTTTGQGLPGKPGSAGNTGSPATTGTGTVTASGYEASNAGTDGSPGGPGGGGGGGAGGLSAPDGEVCTWVFVGAGGGEGGYGGCGGAAGKGGGAGGASIGLLTFQSGVTLSNCAFNTGAGGDGGTPSPGADGQPGGAGGAGGSGAHGGDPPSSCGGSLVAGNGAAGGAGGRGGRGGAGGPGGGGPSIGILNVGSAPATDSLVFNVGAGGKGGTAIEGSDGADGLSTETLTLGASDGGTDVDAANEQ